MIVLKTNSPVDQKYMMDTHDHVGKIFLHSWTVQKTCLKIFFVTA
jgi:hypothetical protein